MDAYDDSCINISGRLCRVLSSHLLFSSERLSRLAAFSDLAYILYPGVFEMITALLKYDVNVRKSRLCVLVFRQGLTCIQLWLNGNIGL